MRWNGPMGSFTEIGGASAGRRPITGDVLKISIVGSLITIYLNGVSIGTAADSTYTTGNPGVGFFTSRDADSNYGFSRFVATGSDDANAPNPPTNVSVR